MRCFTILFIVAMCVGCGGKPDPDVAAAADLIQKRGGSFIPVGATVPVHAGKPLPKRKFTISEVELNQKKITDKELETLKSLSSLQELHLEGSYLTDAGMAHLQNFKQLKELDLHKSIYFTEKGLESLKPLSHLNKLELSYTRIGDKAIENLSALKQLKVLHLTGTKFTPAGIRTLQAALKNCEILK